MMIMVGKLSSQKKNYKISYEDIQSVGTKQNIHQDKEY